jgi:hypothetical protein
MKIKYEELIASMLLEYGCADPLDISLIMNDLKDNYNVEIINNQSLKDIDSYIYEDEFGVIYLENYPFIFEVNTVYSRLVKDNLSSVISDFTKNYFSKLDEHKLRISKKNLLQKEKVTENAHVLVVSDKIDDVEILKSYGFKNINYFKSPYRALTYFESHPNELDNYDIVIRESHDYQVDCHKFTVKMKELIRENKLLYFNFFSVPKSNKLVTNFYDLNNSRMWQVSNDNIVDVMDTIVKCAELNNIIDSKKSELIKIEDKINPNIHIPKKISDLKILLEVDKDLVPYLSKKFSEMGLNVDIITTSSSSLKKKIVPSLGQYDIIISSIEPSGYLYKLGYESCEQCKDTGRVLNLLLTYQDKSNYTLNPIGQIFAGSTDIIYSFAENYHEVTDKKVDIIRSVRDDDLFSKFEPTEMLRLSKLYTDIISVVNVAVCLYDEELNNLNYPKLEDNTMKNADYYAHEYHDAYDYYYESWKLRSKIYFDVLSIDTDTFMLETNEIILNSNEKLNIINNEDGVKIEYILNDNIIGSIYLYNRYNSFTNKKTIGVQTLDSNSNLSDISLVGIHYDFTNPFYNKLANEKELQIIELIIDKCKYIIDNSLKNDKRLIKK